MQTNKSKNQNKQIPSEQGRAAEENASIKSFLDTFFNETSFDEVEDVLFDLTQTFLFPNELEKTPGYLSNTIYDIRRISNLIRKLEVCHKELEGGASC